MIIGSANGDWEVDLPVIDVWGDKSRLHGEIYLNGFKLGRIFFFCPIKSIF